MDATLKVGRTGEFRVEVEGRTVSEKTGLAFPPESEIVSAVKAALGPA